MPWFKIDDSVSSSRKWLSIPKKQRLLAFGAWSWCGAWSANQLTDGVIPKYMLREFGITKAVVSCLVQAGIWSEDDQNVYHLKWDEYQPTRAATEAARAKTREKLRKWRDKKQTETESVTGYEPVSNPAPDPTRPDPTRPTKEGSNVASDVESATKSYEPEVQELCDYLADWVQNNGSKRPTVNDRWLDACDKLMRLDGRTPEQIRAAIDWSQQDEFWRTNILSMSKLRQRYDQLRLAAQRQPASVKNYAAQRTEQHLDLVRMFDAEVQAQEQAQLEIEG